MPTEDEITRLDVVLMVIVLIVSIFAGVIAGAIGLMR